MRTSSRLAAAAAALAAVAAALPAGAAAAQPKAKPNVVVIMSDDQDFRSMWVQPKVKRLVTDRGTTFATNVVNFPLCCPSRSTFFTGMYAHNHKVLWNNWPQGGYYKYKPLQRESLPVWLRRAGYRTIHVGKFLNEYGERNPTEVPTGWDDWHGGVDPTTYSYYGYKINHNGRVQAYGQRPEDYQVDVEAGLAEQAITRAHRAGKPFFLNVAPIAPHTNVKSARVEGVPAIPAPRHALRFAATPLPRYPNFDEADLSDKPTTLLEYFPNLLTPEQVDSLTAHYRGRMGSLLAVDDLVGRVVQRLKATGEYENTVIIYTSDNGWILGEHRLRDPVTEDGKAAGVKYVPYEGSSRVPLVIAGPGIPARRTVRGVTVNADLTPTILELAGARATRRLDGISLLRPAVRPSVLDGRGVIIETAKNPRNVPPYTAIRTQRYRFDVQADGQFGLYDLKADPWELNAITNDPRYARILSILRSKLKALETCKGASCRVNVGKLPEPGR